MTSGNDAIVLRKPSMNDIDSLKRLADLHKYELGFVIRPALQYSIEKSEMFVASSGKGEIVGFIHYRHRKDGQTTLHSIVVDSQFRRRGVGRNLIKSLHEEVIERKQRLIFLKCPEDLGANIFYKECGFSLIGREQGKRRHLQIWTLSNCCGVV